MLRSPQAMHIPDGFLSILVLVICWAISAIVIFYAFIRVKRDMDERKVPLMGVVAAAIFAGQMLNFPVAGGTSGHLLGAALAMILLGPWAAVLSMTVVVSAQALIFQDGGVGALGANLFNMAVIGVFVSYTLYRAVQRLSKGTKRGIFAGGFLAAWTSIFIAALAAALQLAFSGTSPANLGIPAMALVHSVIGLGEGLITVGALAFVYAVRPNLVKTTDQKQIGGKLVWVAGLLIALVLAVASPLASTHPDGLEFIAQQQGFINKVQPHPYNIIPDYVLPGIANKDVATIAAGIVGVLIVFIVALGVALLRRNRTTSSASSGS
ncbi:MAG TPA: energy-coupling factor ABC transporter permease [Anaerolineae bacterium]|nr:energy-coupling factor ABC transporter permease [Anaerolineae bacterium]